MTKNKIIESHLQDCLRSFHLALQEAERQPAPEHLTVYAPRLVEFTQDLTADVAKSKRLRVRSMREQGYTLRGLAEYVGMSYQRIQQIETGITSRERSKDKTGRPRKASKR